MTADGFFCISASMFPHLLTVYPHATKACSNMISEYHSDYKWTYN